MDEYYLYMWSYIEKLAHARFTNGAIIRFQIVYNAYKENMC